MRSFVVAAADPIIRRVNVSVSSVPNARIEGYALLSEGRSSQEAAFILHCADHFLEDFRAALKSQGCTIKQELGPVVEAVEVVEVVEVEVEEEEEVEADLSVLDLSIGKLEEALATGDYDDQLDALLAAEEGGKTRKGAVAALKARMEQVDD
tara:strand:- start:355 stop:810 length:456 start_codon:yes stop_codon:yes gene_type:complete